VGFGALFVTVALLVFSPWMARNYVWKTNPIYPLYNNLFNRAISTSPNSHCDRQGLKPDSVIQKTSKANLTRWSPFAIRKVIYGESWWQIALIPIRIFFQGKDDNPKYFDGKLNPFLFFLPFFAFIHLNKDSAPVRSEKKVFIFFAILFLLYAFSQSSIRIRYVAPIIPPLVILATLGLHQVTTMVVNRTKSQSAWIGSGFVISMLTLILALNAFYIWKQFRYVDPLSYISGRISRDAYIAKYRPEYSVYQYVNWHLPDNAKLLGLFLGNRRYYSERDLTFGVSEFKQMVNRVDSEMKLLMELREKGFTHLIIRFDLFNQWTNRQFDDRKKKLLRLFFAEHVRPIVSKDGYGLFELNRIG
jgi:hypothetical protein